MNSFLKSTCGLLNDILKFMMENYNTNVIYIS